MMFLQFLKSLILLMVIFPAMIYARQEMKPRIHKKTSYQARQMVVKGQESKSGAAKKLPDNGPAYVYPQATNAPLSEESAADLERRRAEVNQIAQAWVTEDELEAAREKELALEHQRILAAEEQREAALKTEAMIRENAAEALRILYQSAREPAASH